MDYNDWMKTLRDIKDPSSQFPFSVNDPKQLSDRIKDDQNLMYKLVVEALNLQERCQKVSGIIDKLASDKQEIELIVDALQQNFLNLEPRIQLIAKTLGKENRDYAKENNLERRVENIIHSLIGQNGLAIQSHSMLLGLTDFNRSDIFNSNKNIIGDSFSDSVERAVSALKDLKKVIDSTNLNLQKDGIIIERINKDVEHIRKHKNLPDF